jgi:hypothetical protein
MINAPKNEDELDKYFTTKFAEMGVSPLKNLIRSM